MSQMLFVVMFSSSSISMQLSSSVDATLISRHDLDSRRAGLCADHGIQVLAVAILGAIGLTDGIIDGSIDGLEGRFLRHAGGNDPPRFLLHPCPIPAGLDAIVGAYVERVADCDGPNRSTFEGVPRGAEACYMQVAHSQHN